MRPIYCTKEDNARERRRAEKFVAFLTRTAKQHVWTFKMSEPMASYDATIYRDGKPVALIEVRDRNGDYRRHDLWHTAKLKVQRSVEAASRLGLPLFLLVSWDEDTFFTRAENLANCRTHISGRRDRGDEKDWEEMILMPPTIFQRY